MKGLDHRQQFSSYFCSMIRICLVKEFYFSAEVYGRLCKIWKFSYDPEGSECRWNCSLTEECFSLILSYSITEFKPAVAGAWCAHVRVPVMSPWQSARKWKMHPENLVHKPDTEGKNFRCLTPRTCSCCKVFSSLNFRSSCDSSVLSNYVGKCYPLSVSRMLMAYRGHNNDYRVWGVSSPCNCVRALHRRMTITLHDLPSKAHSCMTEFYGCYNLMMSPMCEAPYYSKECILHT